MVAGQVDRFRPVAHHRHERGDLAHPGLEERVRVQRSVRAGHGETAGADLGPQAVQRRGEPVGTVVEGHVTAGDHRPGGRQPADLHGRGPPRAFARYACSDATAAGLVQLAVHALQVDEDGPVAAGLVGRLQQLAHLFDRHLQVPEAADGLGGAHLVHRVVPVASADRPAPAQQADVVVVPQRLHAQVGHLGELRC